MQFLTNEDVPFPVGKTVLPNGLTVLTLNTGSEFTDVRVIVRAGSYHDGQTGIGHFVEHLLGEGPARRYGVHPRLRPFFLEGIDETADVGIAEACYGVKCHRSISSQVIPALMDVTLCPDFGPQEVEDERQVILDEIRSGWADREYLRWSGQLLFPNSRWKHNSAAWDKQAVEKISFDDLLTLHSRLYQAQNMALVVTGGITHEEVLEAVVRISIPHGGQMLGAVPDSELCLRNATLHAARLDPEQEWVFRIPRDVKSNVLLEFAMELFNDYNFGPLVRTLRRRENVMYGRGVSVSGTDLAMAKISVESDPDNFNLVEDLVWEAVEQFLSGDWPDELWTAVRNFGTNARLAWVEVERFPPSYGLWADALQSAWVNDVWERPDWLWVYKHVTKEDVLEAARQVFHRDNSALLRTYTKNF